MFLRLSLQRGEIYSSIEFSVFVVQFLPSPDQQLVNHPPEHFRPVVGLRATVVDNLFQPSSMAAAGTNAKLFLLGRHQVSPQSISMVEVYEGYSKGGHKK